MNKRTLVWVILLCFGIAFNIWVWFFFNAPQIEIITNNLIGETLIENPYNDTLIFYEIRHIKRSEQKHYLKLLEKIEILESELNLTKEKIEDLNEHINKHHHKENDQNNK